MRRPHRSCHVLIAAAATTSLLLAGCGGDGGDDATEAPASGDTTSAPTGAPTTGATEDPATEGAAPSGLPTETGSDLPDPNQDVEDGVYAGNGVMVPVPDGWSVDPRAVAQGVVAVVSEDTNQQFTAQAVDTEEAAAAGQQLDFDSLLDNLRQSAPADPAVDEEVELGGAERAHQLTFRDIAAQEGNQPASSATFVLADDGQGVLGEFTYTAAADAYDDETVQLLLGSAGFDPDSAPPAMPQAPAPTPGTGTPPAPEGGTATPTTDPGQG